MRKNIVQSIVEPRNVAGKKETLSLDATATHILEECRMVLPGIQAVFGFQLIAVFNERFSEALSQGEQYMHWLAILLMTLAVALLMAPAAIHRQTQPREVSERFIGVASRLVLLGMLPLVTGLCLDIYLVTRLISDMPWLAGATACVMFLCFSLLWLVLPRYERARQGS